MYINSANVCICLTAAGYVMTKYYPATCKRVLINGLWCYCKIEVKVKNVFRNASQYMFSKLEQFYKYDVFYYKGNVQVGKNTLTKIIENEEDCKPNTEYDYVVYKTNAITPGQYQRRMFNTQEELLEAFYNNGTIHCQPSPTVIVTACMVTKDDEDNSFSKDVTPRHLGVETVGNQLYTDVFIAHFFNIEAPTSYTIYIIDSDINQHTLVNNSEQKQYVEITPNGFEIITVKCVDENEDNFFMIGSKERVQ